MEKNKALMHGGFSWFELMTTDVKGASKFYEKIFNWKIENSNMPGMDYFLVNANGEQVAGMMDMPEECKGMEPGWDIYITVDNVDETAKKVEENGGKILKPPTEIPQVGKFCVIQDPQGAVICAITFKPGSE